MSTRRPRIKASANLALASKRKAKSSTEVVEAKKVINELVSVQKIEPVDEEPALSPVEKESVLQPVEKESVLQPVEETPVLQAVDNESVLQSVEKKSVIQEVEDGSVLHPVEKQYESESLKTECVLKPVKSIKYTQITSIPQHTYSHRESQETLHGSSESTTIQPFKDAFKYPQNPRPSAVVPVEENTVSDFEDNILHMDLQKSPGFPMSPTKSRQRIRPTPIFGLRRNSFVGTSPSPHTEDTETAIGGLTRQRSSNSTSSDGPNSFLMRKLAVGNLGRIRTESGCSTISDSRGSSRKNPTDDHRNINRRDYQRFNGKVPDKSALKMFDLIYYNPTTNPMEQKTPGAMQTVIHSENTAESAESEKVDDASVAEASAMPVPQLKLGSNGEMMIDEKSLEIETTAETEARKLLANSSLIYHDENTGSEGFYRKHKRTKDWLPEETIKFYRCLQTVGTDFSLMLTLFPNRTRRDLKLKFKKEERCNLNLINKALLYPGTFNIHDLKAQLDTEEEERQEQERQWEAIKAKEAKQIKKLKNAACSSSRILVSGDEIYQNENVTKAKLSKRKVDCVGVTAERRKRRTPASQSKAPPAGPSSKSINENVALEREMNEILAPSITSGDTMDSIKSESSDINETSVKLILSELANGTLAFVSSVDPANPDKTVNEIYMMCKETGQLNDKPLDLSDDIVDAIGLMMTS